MASVSESLSGFTRGTLPRLLVLATFFVSLLPLPKDYVLGNGEVFFALHSSFVLLIATGLVIAS